MERINCPVCGEENPAALDNCQHCGQLLRQSTSELNGAGKLIDSGQSPTAKKTSELESALPAWLKNARQGGKKEEESEEPPSPPPSIVEEEAETINDDGDSDDAPVDWLAGLDSEEDDEDEDEEAADWLKNLQGDDTPQEEEESAPTDISAVNEPITAGDVPTSAVEEPIQTGELPNWISDLQESGESKSEALPDLFGSGKETPKEDLVNAEEIKTGKLPHWLSTLSKESATDSTLDATETFVGQAVPPIETDDASLNVDADEPVPDWMAGLQTSDSEKTSSEESGSEIIGNDDLSDWGDVASNNVTPVESGTDEDLPDWMSRLQADNAPPEPSSESLSEETVQEVRSSKGPDLPDWLSGSKDVALEATAISSDEDLPDWIGRGQSDDEAEITSSEDLPDWLSGPKDATPAVTEEKASPEAAPEVLASGTEVEEVAKSANDELADWMADLEPVEEAVSDTDESISAGDNLPDWMADLKPIESSTEESVSETIAESETSPESELPDWLSSASSEELFTQDVKDAPLPLSDSVDEAVASSQEIDPFADLTVGAEETDIPAEEDLPNWLSRMQTPETGSVFTDAIAEEEVEEASVPTDADKPAWLDDLSSMDTVAKEAGGEDATVPIPSAEESFVEDATDEIFGIEMPDWLSALGPEDIDDEEVSDEDEILEEGDVSGTELPSWIQAMRPVADVVPDSSRPSDENVVGTGPLAGLSGVLPVVTVIGQINKPKSHSIKLNVSKSQQSSATMLEKLLAEESEPSSFKVPGRTSSIPVLRWLITILLFLVLGSSLISQSKMVPVPNMEVPEIRNSIDIISQLPSGGSALLIFDYEAGFSGEMKAIASPLITQLLSHGENLVVISTSPTGPALADSLFVEIDQRSDYDIVAGRNYENLGYLAGGASGMSNFISNPRQTVGNADTWKTPPLEKVTVFSDFSTVIILTNDVEKGRNWIEQKTVYAKNNGEENIPPFLMAISAQAEPIIYPYYASEQVEGLISGLSGSAIYEKMMGQENLGRKYWDAYSVGLFLAEILIAFGAIVSFLSALRAQQKKQKEEN